MKFFINPVAVAAVLSLGSRALACVSFGVSIDQFAFAGGNLMDNGATICTIEGYGSNTQYTMKCNAGYSATFPDDCSYVNYNTPHGDYSFAVDVTEESEGGPTSGGDITVCSASAFC